MPPSTGTFPARISTESFPDMTPHPRKMIGLIRFAGVLLAGLTLLSNADLFAQPPVAPAVAPRGGKVFIADVVIQGNRHLSTQQIMAQLGTKPGNEYEPHQVQDDVRKLMATRQFAQVDPRFETLPEGKVVIYFLIKDYPSVVQKVVYQGAKHLSDEELGALTSVVKGKPLSPVTNKLGCQAIVRKYQEMGRMWASCELIKGAEPGDKEVIYNITEGPVVKVRSITFEGQKFVSSGVLQTHIQSSKQIIGLFGGTFNPPVADNDITRLEDYYKGHGYLDARASRELRWTPDGKQVDLVFHVNEGVRYQLQSSPQVINSKSVSAEQLEQLATSKPGEYFNEAKTNQDKKNIEDYIGYMGREARVNTVPIFNPDVPGLVRLQYEVSERAPARVGQIHVVGNERTKQNVVLRQVPVYPGQVLSYPDLRVAERNLARLQLFETSPDGAVRPTVTVIDPDTPGEYKDLLVQVNETTTGSLLFGVGVNSDLGLTGSLVLTERNFDITRLPTSLDDLISGSAFRGAGQEFKAEAVPGTQLQRYSMSWREPHLFDSQISLGTQAYYYSRAFNEYTEGRTGGRVSLGRKINDYWYGNLSARAENVGVYNVAPWEPEDYTSVVGNNFLLGLRANVTRDSRDSPMRPTEGSVIDFSFEQLFGSYSAPLFSAEYNQYWTAFQRADSSGRHVVALRSQFSWAGDNTPVYEKYFAGGFRSMRGFQFRGVGPSQNGYMTGGDFMWINSVEYQLPIKANDQIYLVGFCDTGTVEQSITQLTDYRVSLGVGVRLMVPMMGQVPIALDFGFPVNKAPGDKEQMFNFWVGFFR